MSRYLIDHPRLPNVEVVTGARVSGVEGAGMLRRGALARRRDGRGHGVRSSTCLFIGADPNTDWLAGSGVALDAKGFVRTGEHAGVGSHPLETTRRGVFAIGDGRANSVKRVAAAVGEGAQAVAALHAFLAGASPEVAGPPATSMQAVETEPFVPLLAQPSSSAMRRAVRPPHPVTGAEPFVGSRLVTGRRAG
jgi:thioredoxin reductase (NADPH)